VNFVKLLIVGSRSIKEFDLSTYVSEEVDTIISGGAGGVDSLAEQYADKHGLSKYIIRPKYSVFGRAAPLKRNEKMVDMADAILVIWDGKSKGAEYTMKYTERQNKPLTVVKLVLND
jgi:predicted Rossmann fold nucleotide-binding protein DprA/Smf involved in DNA uptake